MSSVRISLFGKLLVERGGQVTDGLGARKIEELLCYLLLHRHRCHPRDVLADLFWEGNPTSLAKKYLRKALWQLQAGLDTQAKAPASGILLVDPDWIQFNPDADVWLDIAAFEQIYSNVQGITVLELGSQHIHDLRYAVELYRGELLEGWYQDWCVYARERYQYLYLAILDKLMGYCEIHGEFEVGIAYGMRSLDCDRAQERTYRQLMRMHFLAGDRTTALRQYARCCAALQEELGVPPSEATEALCAQIRADHLDEPWARAVQGDETQSILVPYETIEHLKQFCTALAEMLHRVQHHIAIMESTVHRPR